LGLSIRGKEGGLSALIRTGEWKGGHERKISRLCSRTEGNKSSADEAFGEREEELARSSLVARIGRNVVRPIG